MMSGAGAEPAMTAQAPVPLLVSWNITGSCNLACSHCYIDAARRRRNAAQLMLKSEKDRTNEELKALMMLVRKWADEKKENRRGWCQAMHIVVCGGRSKGSLLWNTFPQEAIDDAPCFAIYCRTLSAN